MAPDTMNSRSRFSQNRAADECAADAVGKVRADSRALSAHVATNEAGEGLRACDGDTSSD